MESRGEMKSFYSVPPDDVSPAPFVHSYVGTRARVAVYDGPASAPLIEEIGPAPAPDYIESLSSRVFELARQRGGCIPYTVVREVAENLIHAGFAEPVISVLDGGQTIRFSDNGPGIPDKERAVKPGFTTASGEMKNYIRGVGSGLPIVSDFLSLMGGRLVIDDNISRGAVVTISCAPESHLSTNRASVVGPDALGSLPVESRRSEQSDSATPFSLFEAPPEDFDSPRLSTRQKQVLALVLESGSAGPSIVSRELSVGLSTAYRDLASLEELGLISSEGGKRVLTEEGMSFLGNMSSSAPSDSL